MAKEIVANTGAMYNALTNGSKIVGKIIADSDFRIDGEVEGEIVCNGKVIVGANGLIIGVVNGDIVVSDTLTLRSTANIKGDVKTKVLVVEPNAIFDGTCSMRSNQLVEA